MCAGCQQWFWPRNLHYQNEGRGDRRYCAPCLRALAVEWNEWAAGRASRYKQIYDLSAEEHAKLFLAQAGRCAICRRKNKDMTLVVDHDHASGLVRGLLCSSCNTAIGMFQDDPIRMAAAIRYVLEAQGFGYLDD